MKSLACAFVCLLLATSLAQAQGVGSSGDITGTVTDSAGAVLPKVTVSVVDRQTGAKRTVVTDGAGQYRVAGLSPSTYEVSAALPGFATDLRKTVPVAVGQTVISDFRMKPSQVATVIEVTSEPPVVETERGSQSDRISQDYIADLPIDRRDYLTFTLLMPGVSDSTRLAGDQDYRVKQTPQSGLSFYGSNGRGNSITVDGGETGDDAGGVRLTVSQDAVQEFQINRSNYSADLGSATGASINIVTKSAANKVHGTVYGFFRNDAMDAQNPFSFSQALPVGATFNPANPDSVGTPIKDSLSRQQFGGAVGFPIKKDKTFLFVAFEGLHQNAQNAVPILTNTDVFRPTTAQNTVIAGLTGGNVVPCLSGPVGAAVAAQLHLPAPNPTTNLPAAACGAILGGALTLNPAANPVAAFLVNQFETDGGVFPYDSHQYLASGRLDHRINTSNQLSLTYRYGHDLEESPDVQSLTAFSAGSSIHNYDNNLQGAWYHQFSPSTENEARLQWDYNSFRVIPNAPGEVGLQIPGFINNLGTNIFLPNLTILRRYEFADNFSVIRGRHTLRFGGSEILRGNHTESHTFFPGRFVFGSLPGLLLTPLLPSLTSLQLASFGVPEFYQQGFGNPTYPYYTRPLTSVYGQDSWTVTPSFTLNYGLRYELDSQFAPLTTYKKDFAPRVSFAWDPFKDHKTVIRGGYGIFYGPVDAQIPDVDLSLGVVNKNKSAVENGSGPSQIANLTATCGISQFGIPLIPGSGASPCNREISIYADAGGIPPLAPGLPATVGAATIFQTLFAEGLIQCKTPAPGNAACITPSAVANFGPSGVGINVTNSGPLSPLQVLFVNQPGYRPPIAQQASFGIEREIAPGFSISVSGIYSHTQRLPVAIDTNLLPAPFTTLKLANGQTVSYRNWNGGTPTNPSLADPLGGTEFPGGVSPCANPAACFANPLIVQNNQYSSEAYALYEGGIVEIKKRFSDHFTLFGNYTYSKGFDTSTDFNSDYGPQDPTNINIDRSLSEFDERHKVVIAGVFDSPLKQSILSGFQLSPIFSYHSGHPFNLLAGGEVNGDNHTTNERPIGAPRDTGLGPNYYDFDARLTWQHKVGERANVQITAEGFNLANRTNFASVNNEVSPLFGLTPGFTTFNVHGTRPGTALARGGTDTPSTPLSFTSALPSARSNSAFASASRVARLGLVLALASNRLSAVASSLCLIPRNSMALVENQGARIYWDEQGHGAPVLLIMGLGYTSHMWYRIRPVLAAHYRTIALDNRGVGRSDVPAGPYSIALMASDAAGVLDASGIESAHVFGVSMGGMIAQEFALQYPKRTRSLILGCTAAGGPTAVRAEPEATQMLRARDKMSPEQAAEAAVPFIYDSATPRERIDEDLAIRRPWFPRAEAYAAQLQGILAWEAYSRLTGIATPTLVIHGERDRLVPPGNGKLIAERIPGAKLVMIPHASHLFLTDQTEAARRAVLEFLKPQAGSVGSDAELEKEKAC